MSYAIKALLISLVACTPLSYGSYGHSSSSASSSFQSSMSHSSSIASHGIISSGCGSIGCSPAVISSRCGSIGCSPVVIPSGCGSVECSSSALSIGGLSHSHQAQRSSAVSLNTQAFQSKLIKYQGFSIVPQTLLTQISSLLLSQIQSRKIVYANIFDLCSLYNYDITLINTGLFKFFQENYARGIQYDLEAYYYNRIQTEGSSTVRRIASQFSGIKVSMIQKVMAQYLDYTFQRKTNFNFAECFSSVGINIQSVNVQSLQSMFVNERQSLIYSCPDIKIPGFIFETSQSHSGYNQTEMRARSEFYSSFQNELSQASFSSQSSYERFFSASRSKYSGCSVCLKEIDSLRAQAKTLSKSESSSVSIKQKLESSIKVESEFNSSTDVSSDSSKSSLDVNPSPVAPAAKEADAPVAPASKGGDASSAPKEDIYSSSPSDKAPVAPIDEKDEGSTDKAETPEKEVDTPEKKVETPKKENKNPEKEDKTLEKEVETPEKKVKTPEKKVETPIKEVETHVKEVESPVKGVKNLEKKPGTLTKDYVSSVDESFNDAKKLIDDYLKPNYEKENTDSAKNVNSNNPITPLPKDDAQDNKVIRQTNPSKNIILSQPIASSIGDNIEQEIYDSPIDPSRGDQPPQ